MTVNFPILNSYRFITPKKENNKGVSALPQLKTDEVSFTGIRRYADLPATFIDSDFFRDHKTLQKSVEYIKDNFPKGTHILDYACSNGEETLSLAMLLEPFNKLKNFRITGLDMSTDAERLRKQGVFSICDKTADLFLLKSDDDLSDELKPLKEVFHRFFEETYPPKQRINNAGLFNYEAKYFKNFAHFKPKKGFPEEINFERPIMSDIRDVNEYNPSSKVGAIFFRNGSYFLTKNNVAEFLDFPISTEYNPKVEVLDELAEKIYDRLDDKGIFVLGNNLKEHLFIAPNSVPVEETIKFSDTNIFRRRKQKIECLKGLAKFLVLTLEGKEARLNLTENVRFYKQSPWEKALLKDGKFTPIYKGALEDSFFDLSFPLIWRKNS